MKIIECTDASSPILDYFLNFKNIVGFGFLEGWGITTF